METRTLSKRKPLGVIFILENLEKKLKNIIRHYKNWKNENPDTWILHCKNQSTLQLAIHFAAISRNENDKKHPHQKRISKETLSLFAECVNGKINEISNVTNFEKLLDIVESCKIKGIGKLAYYDCANRIGEFLGLFPNKIYLHAGTKVGAEYLLKKKLKTSYIVKSELPIIFQTTDLDCGEIEDILCIYKEKFKGN